MWIRHLWKLDPVKSQLESIASKAVVRFTTNTDELIFQRPSWAFTTGCFEQGSRRNFNVEDGRRKRD
jgi:hypothetical protein